MVSALNYPIVFDFTTKGQEQLAAADKLIQQLDSILKQVSTTFTTFGSSADTSSQKVATSQTKIGDSAARVVTEVGKEGQAFTALDASQSKVGTSMNTLVQNQDKVVAGTTRLNTEITKEQTTLTALDQSQIKSAQSMTQMATSHTAVADSAVKVTTEIGKENVALTTMDESQKKLATDLGAVTTGMEQQGTAVTKGVDGMTKLTKETDNTEKSQKKLQGTTKETVGSMNQEKTAVEGVSTKMKEGAQSTDQMSTSTKNVDNNSKTLKQSLTSLAGGVTTLGTSIISLWQSYDSLGDAQLAVDKTTIKVSQSQEALNKAQAKLNVLVAEGQTGTAEYSQALLDVEQASMKFQVALGNQTNAQEQLNITQANFYMNVIPQLMGVIGSLATIYGSASLAVDNFKKKTAEAGVQAGLTSKLMATISVTNPFFLALTIGGSILAAFITNLGGFRDKLNEVGVALGNAAGPLKPFLTMIGDLGNGLTKMFGGATDETKVYAETTEASLDAAGGAFGSYGTTAVSALDMIQKKLSATMADIKSNQVLLDNYLAAANTPTQPGTVSAPITAQTEPTVKKGGFIGSVNLQPPTGVQSGATVPLGADVSSKAVKQSSLVPQFKELAQGVTIYKDAVNKLSFDQAELTKKLQESGFAGVFLQANLAAMNKSLSSVSLSQDELTRINAEYAKTTGRSSEQTEKETIATLQGNDAKLKMTAAQQAVLLKNQEYSDSIDASKMSLTQLNAVLGDQSVRQSLVTDAQLKQEVAMKTQTVTALTQIATLTEYNEQLSTTEGRQSAMLTGQAKQLDSFVKEKAAVLENVGAYQVLSRQLSTGEAQAVRYNKAYSDTMITIRSGALDIAAIRGEINATNAMMQTGEAQNNAWARGFEETRKNIQATTLAIIEQEGAIVAQIRALDEGTLAEQAHNQASTEFKQGLIDTVTEIEKLRQTTDDYNAAVKDGIPQALAYEKAFLTQQDAATKLDEELAGLIGTYDALKKQLTDITIFQKNANIGFQEGANSALLWKQSLDSSYNNNLGFMSELDEIAKGLGVTMPQAFKYSVDAAKEWTEIQLGLPEAIDKGLKKAAADGKQALDDLTAAWDKGNNLSKKEINKILGENVPDSYRKKLNYEIEIEVNEAEMSQRLSNALAVMNDVRPDTRAQAQGIVDDLLRDVNTAFRNGKVSEEFNNNVITMMGNMPDPKDVPAWDAWIAEFKLLQEAIDSGDPEKIRQTVSAMADRQAEIKKAADAIKNYDDALKNIIATYGSISLEDFNKKNDAINSAGMGSATSTDRSGNVLSSSAALEIDPRTQNEDGSKKQQAPKVDTTAIDEAMAKMATLTQALALLGPATTEAVNQMNAAFATLNPLQEGFTSGMELLAEAYALAIEGAQFAVDEMNTAMGLIGSTFNGAAQITKPIADAFAQAQSNSQPYIIGIGTDFAQYVVGKIREDTKGLGAAVVAEFETMRSGIISKLNAIGSAAQSTFDQILSYVKSVTAELKSVPSVIPVEYRVSVTGDTPPSAAASGFTGLVTGSHTITVGEAGPEFVSIIPLKNKMPGGNRSFAAQGFQGIAGADGLDGANANGDQTSNTTSTGVPGTQAGVQDVRVVGIGLQNISGGVMPVFISGSAISFGNGGTGGTGSGSGSGSGTGGSGTSGGGLIGGGSGSGTGNQQNQQSQKYWVTENGTQYYWENQNGVIRTNMNAAMLSKYHLQAPSNSVEGSMGPVGSGIYPGVGGQTNTGTNTGGGTGTGSGTGTGGGGAGSGTGGSGTVDPTSQIGNNLRFGVSPGAHPNTYGGPIGGSADGMVRTWGGEEFTVAEWNRLSDQERAFYAESDDEGFKHLPPGYTLNEDYSLSRGISGTSHALYVNNTTATMGPNSGEPSPYYDASGRPKSRRLNDPWTYSGSTSGPGGVPAQGGTGSGTGTGGTGGTTTTPPVNQGGTGQTPGTGTGSVNGDKNSLEMGGYSGGTYKTVTGYTVPNYIQSPGHGATNAAQWTNPNVDPRSWKAMPMVSDPNLWKVVDDKGINIAAKFVEEDQANEFIQEHIFAVYGNGAGTGQTPGTGTGTPPVNQNGTGSSGTGTGGTVVSGPQVPAGVQTSGTGKNWAGSADTDSSQWSTVKMNDDPSKYKVIDKNGRNVAAGFSSQKEADDWRNAYTQTPGGTGQTPGTGTGQTPGTGTGTGTGTSTGTSYTVPTGVLTADPNPATDPEGRWTNVDTSNPNTWTAITMNDDPNLWKVVNNEGKNIAILFNSKAEADEYINKHKLAKQRGGNAAPTAGGGTLNIPGEPGTGGTSGTPPVNQNGTGGMTTVPSPYDIGMNVVQINDNGKQLFWKKQNGVITTNMSAAQLRQYGLEAPSGTPTGGIGGLGGIGGSGTGGLNIGGLNFPAGFPFQDRPEVQAGGGPNIGGIQFPVGFPFNNVGGGGGGGSGGIGTGSGGGSTQTTRRAQGNGMYLPMVEGFGDNQMNALDPSYTKGVNWPSGGIYTQPYAPSMGGTGTGTGTQTNTGGNFQYTDANGNHYNFQNDVNTQSNVSGNGALVPTGGMTTASSAVPTSTGTGQVITPSGTVINRSQTVSQTSTGGQNYYYQNQDGHVNTNFPGGQIPDSLRGFLDMFGLGGLFGGGGGGGSGVSPGSGSNVGNRPVPGELDVRTGIDNTVPIYDVGPQVVGRDFATQRIQATTPAKPGKPGKPGLPGFDFGDIDGWIKDLMEMIFGRVKDGLSALKMDINLDGQSIFKSYSLDLMRRYNSQF